MFAVIKTGGKQYRVAADDVLRIERIEGAEGSRVQFGNVLMVGEGADVSIGSPSVDGASVTAEVVEQGRGKKSISFKKRRRQNSRRKKGHRQHLTTISILEILTDNAKPKREASGKSAAERSSEAQAAYLASVGSAIDGDQGDDGTAAGSGAGKSRKGAAKAKSGGSATDARTAGDEGLIEGSATDEAVADAPAKDKAAPKKAAKSDDTKKAAPKKAKPVVESEDDAAADHEAEQAADAKAASAKASAPEAPVPGEPMFTAPEGEKDKLTQIKGIGPVAERQLNEQGITTFAQIAALTDEDVERIDAYMPFSAAQITTWREQAQSLK